LKKLTKSGVRAAKWKQGNAVFGAVFGASIGGEIPPAHQLLVGGVLGAAIGYGRIN